jgi:hypothetical protein
MGKTKSSSNFVSKECKTGNHDECPGQVSNSKGNTECRCVHHKNVPTSVADIPVTSDTPWRVAHDG